MSFLKTQVKFPIVTLFPVMSILTLPKLFYFYDKKFSFVNKHQDFNMVKRTMFAKTKPEIVIGVNGKAFMIRTVTSLKTINAEFTLDEPYENDLTGEKETYITTIEGNKLVTKLVINGKVTDIVMTTREFTDTGFVQTYYGKTGVTGTRTFEKA